MAYTRHNKNHADKKRYYYLNLISFCHLINLDLMIRLLHFIVYFFSRFARSCKGFQTICLVWLQNFSFNFTSEATRAD